MRPCISACVRYACVRYACVRYARVCVRCAFVSARAWVRVRSCFCALRVCLLVVRCALPADRRWYTHNFGFYVLYCCGYFRGFNVCVVFFCVGDAGTCLSNALSSEACRESAANGASCDVTVFAMMIGSMEGGGMFSRCQRVHTKCTKSIQTAQKMHQHPHTRNRTYTHTIHFACMCSY